MFLDIVPNIKTEMKFVLVVLTIFSVAVTGFGNNSSVYKYLNTAAIFPHSGENRNLVDLDFSALNHLFKIKAASGFDRVPVLGLKFKMIRTNSSGYFQIQQNTSYLIGGTLNHLWCRVYGHDLGGTIQAVLACPEQTYSISVNHHSGTKKPFEPKVWNFPEDVKEFCDNGICDKVLVLEGPIRATSVISRKRRKTEKYSNELLPQGYSEEDNHNSATYYKNKVCDLHLVVDHTFARHNRHNDAKMQKVLTHIIGLVDSAFQKADFDEDDRQDNLGFTIKRMTILDLESEDYDILADENLPGNSPKESLINNFARWLFLTKQKKFCMNILFVHRNLSELGIAFLAESKPDGNSHSGGICDNGRAHIPGIGTVRPNVAVVTTLSKGKSRSNEEVALTLLHELGHAFGAPHDNDKALENYPGCNNKVFGVMATGTRSDHNVISNWAFSLCSTRHIFRILRRKGKCLQEREEGICGDGIVQGEEECDCGSAEICQHVDPCCNPIGSADKPCTLSSGSVCSPSKSPCCNQQCQIINDNSLPCRRPLRQCSTLTFCDGRNADCPKSSYDRDGESCEWNSLVCHHGKCEKTPCELYNLLDCNCLSSGKTACSVCCMTSSGKCLPTSELGIFTARHANYTRPPFFRCNGNKGFCDLNNTCVQFAIEKVSGYNWKSFALGAVGLLLLLCIVISSLLYYIFKTLKYSI